VFFNYRSHTEVDMKEKERCLTQEYLKEALHYDENNGIFTWNHRPLGHFKSKWASIVWNKTLGHKSAGSAKRSRSTEYIYIRINSKAYLAHRLAWLYIHGEWPNQIDHEDGNGLNNKLKNLRNVSNKQNAKNCRVRKNNKSGIMGVILNKKTNKWESRIKVNYKQIYLYSGSDLFEACCCRKSAEYKHGFHANHGRVQ
jgi:hypothetical protein